MRRTTDLVRILVLVGVLVHLGLIDDEVAAALPLLLFPSKVPTYECRVAAERLTYTITLICDNDKGGGGLKSENCADVIYGSPLTVASCHIPPPPQSRKTHHRQNPAGEVRGPATAFLLRSRSLWWQS